MDNFLKLQDDRFNNLLKATTNYKKTPKDRFSKGYIESRLEQLEKLYDNFLKTHEEIVVNITAEDKTKSPYFVKDVLDNFEENYITYRSKLKNDLQQYFKKDVTSSPGPSQSTMVTSDQNILPRIQLPTFSGKYQEWQTFYDLFDSLVHKNSNIPDVQKLQHLKSKLVGEPEVMLRNLPITESNYQEAWRQLTRRYTNKRYNCNAVMKVLFAQKQINVESSVAIKQLLDTTTSCLQSLNNIGVSTKSWDAIIVHMVVTKLDPESHRQWENKSSEMTPDDISSWQNLTEFLETRFRTLEIIDAQRPNIPKLVSNKPIVVKTRAYVAAVEQPKSNSQVCILCNGPHFLYQCKDFGLKPAEKRQEFAQQHQLCFNCLIPNHPVKYCRQRTSCRRCGRKHHSLLHTDKLEPQNQLHAGSAQIEHHVDIHEPETEKEKTIISNFAGDILYPSNVLLATAKVKSMSHNGQSYVLRALIDQGSQASFVTEETVQRLGLKKAPIQGTVTGIGENHTKIKYAVTIKVEPYNKPEQAIEVRAYVLSSLSSFMPSKVINITWDWLLTDNLTLADPGFKTPSRIDLLLGADVYGDILLDGIRKHPQGGILAQNTTLGWIISGRTTKQPIKEKIIAMHTQIKEDNSLKQFWQIEAEPNMIEKRLTKQEIKCEELFENSTIRAMDGRMIVKLPFTDEDPDCQYGKLRDIALKRYTYLERKLTKNPDLKKEYNKVLQEYIELEHMTIIEDEIEKNKPNAVYLPHHAVVRNDKDTTKVRIVFDASCKGVNNVSLNDNLMVGPKLQQDLRHILMRWRFHKICLVADIIKMYRQVRVKDEDTQFQRILWRREEGAKIEHYKLLTLTFGTACAPYLAVKSLQHLADLEKEKYPMVSNISKTDFYMDDLMTGCETLGEAVAIYNEMNELMSSGGFTLQKWSSNNKEILDYMNTSKQPDNELHIKLDETMKVLGIKWNRNTDNFEYTVNTSDMVEPITKRKVLSEIARQYDPMGWIAPVIVIAKIYIQKLWKENLHWDDPLPKALLKQWTIYREGLTQIKDLHIPRWINYVHTSKVELHAFADASQSAFAAVIFARVIDECGRVTTSLITAKTKVAPVEKEISIPRLELCAATLAAKLLFEVAQITNISKEDWYAWTDSTVVLAWLKGLPCKWHTFISNRVSEILTILDYEQWRHVNTYQNPADCASRGLHPAELKNHKLWWHGPEWLSCREIDLTKREFTTKEEMREVRVSTHAVQNTEFIWDKYSTLDRMLQVFSYCRRLLKQNRINERNQITSKERKETLHACLRQLQSVEFSKEIKNLRDKKDVEKKSELYTLRPILDERGLIRVGGRIELSNLKYDQKHPIVLPSHNHLSNLIVLDAHHKTFHGGPQVMLNYLKSKFWIIRVRNLVKKCYRNCITCTRFSKKSTNQLMGQIPRCRMTPTKPFRKTGVDFAGPIMVRFSPGRGSKSYKGYICLFICMVSRAIHLEAVSDLTSKGFIAAFRRFTSRRGHCQDLYSDNGTNFTGAEKLLRDMFDRAKSSLPDDIAKLLVKEGTDWHFIPPQAPNFGGLWEAGVKSTKTHLRKVIGDTTLTFEELSTVLSQIEACLNSRPLTQFSDDPSDPLPLTPGHFLVGEPLIHIPDDFNENDNIGYLQRWRLVQKIVNDFWKRWSKEYLLSLNQRYKWATIKNEPEVNDIVIVKDENLPPTKWLLGRIVNKHTGPDNLTRVVTVQCKDNCLKRPLNKLVLLPKNIS